VFYKIIIILVKIYYYRKIPYPFLVFYALKAEIRIFYKKINSMKVKEQGLYLPEFEHDNCGAGFICNLNGIKSNDIIHKAQIF
jgi:glutamate synthase (ferredoxin)